MKIDGFTPTKEQIEIMKEYYLKNDKNYILPVTIIVKNKTNNGK